MQPIFTEKEEDGIYEATLSVITDDGTSIRQIVQVDLNSIIDKTTKKLLSEKQYNMSDIIKGNIDNAKAKAVTDLHKYFTERLNSK